MVAFVRLMLLALFCLTIVYVCLSFYFRALRRERLLEKWRQGSQRLDCDTFVQRGLERYDGIVRRRLLIGVYILPAMVFAVVIYITNAA
ncbi:MAG: hypothetical protein AAF755_01875 [Pseudomonadota bacterium]